MATVNYYLKGAISEEKIKLLHTSDSLFLKKQQARPLQIFLKLSLGGERLQIYTKKRVAQKYWDREKQRADCQKLKTGGTTLNEWLFEFEKAVLDFAQTNENNLKHTTANDLKALLDKKILAKPSKTNFETYFNDYLAGQKTGDGHSLRLNTVKKYNGLKNHLIDFATESKRKLDVPGIDKDFLSEFKDYLIAYEKKLDDGTIKKLTDNTIAKNVKAAKSFIRFYMNKNVIKPFNIAEVKSVEREGAIFVLPIKQLIELQNEKLESDKLNKVRDVFCFMCWTGQRFSDIEKLKHSDIIINEKGEREWRLITQKNNATITVPITPYADKILAKYKKSESPLPTYSNQKLNEYLKELGEKVGLKNSVKVVKYYDGLKTEESLPFYEILTTHVGRKSYITNSLILGVPERVVKEVSGHKDEKSFRRYVQLADAYKSKEINKAFSIENISKFL